VRDSREQKTEAKGKMNVVTVEREKFIRPN